MTTPPAASRANQRPSRKLAITTQPYSRIVRSRDAFQNSGHANRHSSSPEDDAQSGPDHVDAHRSPAYVISPYTRRAAVDSTMYSTSSLLRTIELILGLQYIHVPIRRRSATPMFNAFQSQGRPTAHYDALPANVDLNEKNPERGLNAQLSRQAWS